MQLGDNGDVGTAILLKRRRKALALLQWDWLEQEEFNWRLSVQWGATSRNDL